jgi:hypothetical protein
MKGSLKMLSLKLITANNFLIGSRIYFCDYLACSEEESEKKLV